MKQLIIFVVLCLPLLYSCGVPQQQETDTAYKTLTIKSGDQILKTGFDGKRLVQLLFEDGRMLKSVRR